MNAEAPARQEIAEPRRPARISTVRRLYWSVRRELWENQSIYVVPLGVAALIVLGFLINAIRLPETMRAAAALPALHGSSLIRQPYLFAELLLMASTFVVGAFYSLDALQSERRDRSILFWKSLPVSDRTTVLAKASIPLLVLPLLTFAVTFATQLVMLLLESAVLRAGGQAVAPLWSQMALPSRSAMLLYHLVTVHGLWYAPIFAWLLLASAWARRAAWLWAALPPLAVAVVEKIAFGSARFASLLSDRIAGGLGGDDFMAAAAAPASLVHLAPGTFLRSPGLWTGLLLAAAFLALAVQVRHRRDPS